jgi:hypothetical protein
MRHDGSSQLSVVRLTRYLIFGVAGHRIGLCSSSATSRVAHQDVWLDRLFWTTGRLLNFAGNAGGYIRITDMMCGRAGFDKLASAKAVAERIGLSLP